MPTQEIILAGVTAFVITALLGPLMIPVLKKLTHLPVIVDPSHATGISWMVKPMALAATAAGADGLMIEVHNDPKRALCDGAQSLTPEAFRDVMEGVRAVLPHAWHMPKEGV